MSCSSVASPALILFAEAFWLDMLSTMPAAATLCSCWGCRSSGRACGRHCSTIVDPLEPFEAGLQGNILPVKTLVSIVIVACIAMCQVKNDTKARIHSF